MEKMKLNEPGRQKLGRLRGHVSRHNTKSYILTYYGFKKRELLIALCSHQGGPLIYASAVPHITHSNINCVNFDMKSSAASRADNVTEACNRCTKGK